MAVYNVVAPCIVGGKHYIHPADDVEIDDAEAAPFVESGLLVAVQHEVVSEPEADPEVDPEVDVETPRRGRAPR